MHVGIDFGTTRSVVAVSDRGNYPVVSFLNEEGDASDWYPSMVAATDRTLRFGWSAASCVSDTRWSVLRSFKRLLADPEVRPDRTVRIGPQEMPILELLVRFLRALAHDLRHRSNLPQELKGADPIPSLIATPANAHGTQRFLTLEAFREAGFEPIGLLNEPSAAGFEYAHRHRDTFTSKRERIVVYDLGGGTFDASLVRMSSKHHDITHTAGVPRLGGDDFDEVLVELVLEEMGVSEIRRGSRAWIRLADACRDAKEALGPRSRRVLVDVESALGDGAPQSEVVLPVSRYYEACSPLIERTFEAMGQVIEHGDPAGGSTGSLPGIAGIYVVGGASALPAVGRALRNRYGRRIHRSPYPSAATAIGLAIAGDPDAGYHLTDRFSRAFGVFRELRDGAAISFDPIFTKDTSVPNHGQERVSATRRYRAAHNIGHFRYVECESVDPSGQPSGDITPFAEAIFPFDPALCGDETDVRLAPIRRVASPGPLVEEHYTIDGNGLVEVRIRNVDAGYTRVFRLWGSEALPS